MRAFVFTDPALGKRAGQFVWLSIDTEKSSNAAFLRKYPVRVWPTLMVIDPATETISYRWAGGATLAQLQKLLDGARRHGGTKETALARADRLYADQKYPEAAKAYREALRSAPRGWKEEARATDALLFALQSSDEHEPCVEAAREAFPRLRHTPSAPNVVTIGLDCALALPAGAAGRADRIAELEKWSREVLADSSLVIAADDRSGIYDELVSALDEGKDEAGKKHVAAEWARYLEGEAARAKTPDARAVFDSHRVAAYMAMGEPEKAIPMLVADERDLPADYNPPARLAYIYKTLKRWDDALAASDRALAKAYGPRRLGILQTRADIFVGKGDKAQARTVLEQALAEARAMPEGQRSEAAIENLQKKIEKL
jgi:tetratricopeptide (TPR) repeat protein